MGWTLPKTWVTGDLITANDMNTHVKENLIALKGPATLMYNSPLYLSTTSTSFVDIDATNLTFNATTSGGRFLIGMIGKTDMGSFNTTVYFDFRIGLQGSSGVQVGNATNGIISALTSVSFDVLYLSNIFAAGTYTIKPMWKVANSSAGVNLSQLQWWVREVLE